MGKSVLTTLKAGRISCDHLSKLMKVGIISDTHSYIDALTLNYLSTCNEIWHAGDIGDEEVMRKLNDITKTRAVFGNIDGVVFRKTLPEDNFFSIGSLKFLITHIAGSPPKYNARIKKLLSENKVDVLVCGHSHILKVLRDANSNLLYINPGAAGIHGFHKMRTIVTMRIKDNRIEEMQVVELGKRGALKD